MTEVTNASRDPAGQAIAARILSVKRIQTIQSTTAAEGKATAYTVTEQVRGVVGIAGEFPEHHGQLSVTRQCRAPTKACPSGIEFRPVRSQFSQTPDGPGCGDRGRVTSFCLSGSPTPS